MNRINLNELKNPYVDLSGFGQVVVFEGVYKGPRIVVSNHSGKVIRFEKGQIETTHKEDALCFAGESRDMAAIGIDFKILGGGITFWGRLENVRVHGFKVLFPHTGIRATGDWPNRKVEITENVIIGASHEGIYMGISKETDKYSDGLKILNNVTDTTGWDGIQVGNWRNAHVGGNTVIRPGLAEEFGQQHAICINPGAQVWDWENEIIDAALTYIVNKATLYKETKPKGY